MKINPKVVQTLGAGIIPIAGFYFWNWDLYFILLYYVFDQLFTEVMVHLMSRDIAVVHHGSRITWLRKGVFSFIQYLLFVVLVHLAFLFLIPGISFVKRIEEFLTYKELGIQQWVFLFPLLFLVSYQRYNMEFKMRGGARVFTMVHIWNKQLATNLYIVICTLIIAISAVFVVLPQAVYLWMIVIGSTIFGLYSDRFLNLKPTR